MATCDWCKGRLYDDGKYYIEHSNCDWAANKIFPNGTCVLDRGKYLYDRRLKTEQCIRDEHALERLGNKRPLPDFVRDCIRNWKKQRAAEEAVADSSGKGDGGAAGPN